MKHLDIPWSFYFQFNHETQLMRLQLSDMFQQKENMPNKYYVLSYDDVTKFLHKYDHRKLSYFFDHDIKDTFDMILRIKNFNKKKGYIKTHALCYIKNQTMHCLSINYLDVIKAKKKLDLLVTNAYINIDINDQHVQMFRNDIKIDAFERHLNQLVHRAYTI